MVRDSEPLDSSDSGDVVAIAIVPAGVAIDWQGNSVPEETLWLPEHVVVCLASRSTHLAELNIYEQSHLSSRRTSALLSELEASVFEDPNIQIAAEAVCATIRKQLATPGTELLIEGP